MKANPKKEISLRLLWILALLLPLIVLFLLPGGGMMLGGIWFWLILLLSLLLIWSLLGVPADEGETAVETEPRMLSEPEQPEAIREAMNVQIATEEAGVQIFRSDQHDRHVDPFPFGTFRLAGPYDVGDHCVLHRRTQHAAAQRCDTVYTWSPLDWIFNLRYSRGNSHSAAACALERSRVPLPLSLNAPTLSTYHLPHMNKTNSTKNRTVKPLYLIAATAIMAASLPALAEDKPGMMEEKTEQHGAQMMGEQGPHTMDKENMRKHMQASNAELDKLVAAMNSAEGGEKVDAIAAVVNKFVEIHMYMSKRMMKMRKSGMCRGCPMHGMMGDKMMEEEKMGSGMKEEEKATEKEEEHQHEH